jgi:16S rRNA (cytidine1402-2'-O)-methyltransferase
MPDENTKGGVLYIVATPIGNPDDLSPRAVSVLSGVDLVACEDTRRAARLLASRGIRKPLVSYFEHNEERRARELLERLVAGAEIALITDAGTPGISDPGFRLVRAAAAAGIRITAVPGASAVVAALSISGLPTDRFTFEGFLPARDAARKRTLDALRVEPRTMVFLEAARRLPATISEMAAAFGESRRAAVMRELTKTHEEVIRGSLGDLARRFAQHKALGEVTIVVEGTTEPEAAGEGTPLAKLTVEMLLEAGLGLRAASEVIAKLQDRSRREVYQEALQRKRTAK